MARSSNMYQFSALENFLDQNGFPSLDSQKGFQVVRRDFKKEYLKGNIEFRDDGIYLDFEGQMLRGYMFIKEAFVSRYGNFPKFHLIKCKKIQEFIDRGTFKDRYEWSNSDINDIIDKTTKKVYNNTVLELCGFCAREITDNIKNTGEFYETLDTDQIHETEIELDLFGYTRDWEKVSKKYRESVDYTCQECGVQILERIDYRYMHTHHKNGDKTNNKMNNLECLCALCHMNSDDRHIENFSKGRSLSMVKSFVTKYERKLLDQGNTYVASFQEKYI